MTKQQLLALLRESFKMGYSTGYNDSSELGIENSVDSEINYFLNCIDADNRVGDLELPDINKLKADAVREAIVSLSYKGDSQYDVLRQIEEYADKLERGEI